jgi:hypothetical protein
MKFTIDDEIAFPIDEVFPAYRDKLHEMLDYMDNVERIEVKSREVDGDVVNLLNHWYGVSSDIPSALRPVLKPDMLSWLDKAKWDEGKHRVDWDITLPALPDAIVARGFTLYKEDGDVTVVQISGEFLIHPDKIPGVPTFVAKRLAPTLEKFVIGLLQPNLKKSNKAVEEYLQDQA